MHPIILRFAVTFVSFIAGVSLTSVWNSLRETSNHDTSVLVSTESEWADDGSSSGPEGELREIYDQYAVAQTRHDAAFFEQTEAEDFILFRPFGKGLSRAEDIELLKTQEPGIKYSTDDVHMQLYGDAAIVTGRMRATYPSDGSYSWPWIDVCVRRNGRWQILSTTQVN